LLAHSFFLSIPSSYRLRILPFFFLAFMVSIAQSRAQIGLGSRVPSPSCRQPRSGFHQAGQWRWCKDSSNSACRTGPMIRTDPGRVVWRYAALSSSVSSARPGHAQCRE
jgi:hypothetical protein